MTRPLNAASLISEKILACIVKSKTYKVNTETYVKGVKRVLTQNCKSNKISKRIERMNNSSSIPPLQTNASHTHDAPEFPDPGPRMLLEVISLVLVITMIFCCYCCIR